MLGQGRASSMPSLLEQLAADGLLDEAEQGLPTRRSIVLAGVTGDGKSSTANTLCGAQGTFAVSGGLASCSECCEHADYSYGGAPYRVVDTIGLQDSGLSCSQVMERFSQFGEHTPNGIDCFLFVARLGR